MIETGKKLAHGFWLLSIIVVGTYSLLNPHLYDPDNIVSFIEKFGSHLLVFYIIFSLLRGFFFVPSTPFVIAGSALFPGEYIWVLLITMTGVIFSSTLLYFFSDSLGFSHFFKKKYPKRINQIENYFNKRNAIFFVIGWSFFPFVPTELISYVAGITKMPYKFMISGIIIGEFILMYAAIYLGISLSYIWGIN